MQSIFQTYFQLGFEHITDLEGYDHILFIIALCAIYTLSEWKKVALLATAFTIGHSITLALAVFEIIPTNLAWIEFLIPVTIFITALYNVVYESNQDSKMHWNYILAALFGLIHGMGFSNYLRSLLMGIEKSIAKELLAFNLGVELGQLSIVVVVLFISYFFIKLLDVKQNTWKIFISGAAAGISLLMALERFPLWQ